MSVAANLRGLDRARLIALAGAGVALGAILWNLGSFLRPGFDDVLGGLAHHAFVLGLLLALTAGSRTVRLGTLGIFWLIGVWSVYAVAYLLESGLASLFDADTDGSFVTIWLAPFVEETMKLLPVAAFLLLAVRRGRQPSMSDGLLLGFMVGAGVSFMGTLTSERSWSRETVGTPRRRGVLCSRRSHHSITTLPLTTRSGRRSAASASVRR
jgi:hypothetical protein